MIDSFSTLNISGQVIFSNDSEDYPAWYAFNDDKASYPYAEISGDNSGMYYLGYETDDILNDPLSKYYIEFEEGFEPTGFSIELSQNGINYQEIYKKNSNIQIIESGLLNNYTGYKYFRYKFEPFNQNVLYVEKINQCVRRESQYTYGLSLQFRIKSIDPSINLFQINGNLNLAAVDVDCRNPGEILDGVDIITLDYGGIMTFWPANIELHYKQSTISTIYCYNRKIIPSLTYYDDLKGINRPIYFVDNLDIIDIRTYQCIKYTTPCNIYYEVPRLL